MTASSGHLEVMCASEEKAIMGPGLFPSQQACPMCPMQDPYAIVSIQGAGSQYTTGYKSKTHTDGGTDPVWNHTFNFHNISSYQTLRIEVWDFNKVLRDKQIGVCTLPLTQVCATPGAKQVGIPVQTTSGYLKGLVHCRVTFTPSGAGTKPKAQQLAAAPGTFMPTLAQEPAALPPAMPAVAACSSQPTTGMHAQQPTPAPAYDVQRRSVGYQNSELQQPQVQQPPVPPSPGLDTRSQLLEQLQQQQPQLTPQTCKPQALQAAKQVQVQGQGQGQQPQASRLQSQGQQGQGQGQQPQASRSQPQGQQGTQGQGQGQGQQLQASRSQPQGQQGQGQASTPQGQGHAPPPPRTPRQPLQQLTQLPQYAVHQSLQQLQQQQHVIPIHQKHPSLDGHLAVLSSKGCPPRNHSIPGLPPCREVVSDNRRHTHPGIPSSSPVSTRTPSPQQHASTPNTPVPTQHAIPSTSTQRSQGQSAHSPHSTQHEAYASDTQYMSIHSTQHLAGNQGAYTSPYSPEHSASQAQPPSGMMTAGSSAHASQAAIVSDSIGKQSAASPRRDMIPPGPLASAYPTILPVTAMTPIAFPAPIIVSPPSHPHPHPTPITIPPSPHMSGMLPPPSPSPAQYNHASSGSIPSQAASAAGSSKASPPASSRASPARGTTPTPSSKAGRILDQSVAGDCWAAYEIRQVLGKGHNSITYQALKKDTRQVFAVKVFDKAKLTSEEKEDLKREVQVLHHLQGNPGVVSLKDVFEDQKNVCLVTDLCTGGTLMEKLLQRTTFNEKEAAHTLRDMLMAVQYCHNMGVLHRDLEPDKFLYSDKSINAQVKLSGFSFATFFKEGERLKDVLGTPYYVAPEVIRGRYNKEADIWSLGVILYMLLSGQRPFDGAKQNDVLLAVKSKALDLSAQPWKQISEAAKDCVTRMLERDRHKRAITAELLQHPWLKAHGVASEVLPELEVITRMKRFSNMSYLKQQALKVLAKQSGAEVSGMVALFDEMDRDHSGTVSIMEFVHMLRKKLKGRQQDLEPEQVDELAAVMKAVDLNGDGTLDIQEFLAAMVNPARLCRDDDLQEVFRYFDQDGNGYIDHTELCNVLQGMRVDDAHIHHAMQEFFQHDTNGDCRVDWQEFKTLMRN